MDDNASQALMMAFSIMVFLIALSISMYMFSKVTTTSETLAFYADTTRYYDNVAVVGREGIERYVNTETIIPTLYRYNKENFCVKIYDATGLYVDGSTELNPGLIQIFDVDLENKVEYAVRNTKADGIYIPSDGAKLYEDYALKMTYNDPSKYYHMFGVPWVGSTEDMKQRVDYYVNGEAGYIQNKWVDYRNNPFYQMRNNTDNRYQFKERFINYSYTGETMETEEGDILVTGADSKDKIVIIYTLVDIVQTETNAEEKARIQEKLNEM